MASKSNAAVAEARKIDIGITEKDRKAIADGLSHLLADTYTLYLKTHNYHWNVTGPMFHSLHLLFELGHHGARVDPAQAATLQGAARVIRVGFCQGFELIRILL